MAERKRFKFQNLNSHDYEKTEEAVKIVKNGSKIVAAGTVLLVVAKKYGPSLLKSISKIRKL